MAWLATPIEPAELSARGQARTDTANGVSGHEIIIVIISIGVIIIVIITMGVIVIRNMEYNHNMQVISNTITVLKALNQVDLKYNIETLMISTEWVLLVSNQINCSSDNAAVVEIGLIAHHRSLRGLKMAA